MKVFDVFNVFYLGTGGMGGGVKVTNCFDLLAKNGNLVGKDDSVPFGDGTLTPDFVSSGTYIYAWTADVVTGDFELRLGAAGNEQEPNTDLFVYQIDGDNVELNWDISTLRYAGSDLTAAKYLDTLVGTKVCIAGLAIPVELIRYDFLTEGD